MGRVRVSYQGSSPHSGRSGLTRGRSGRGELHPLFSAPACNWSLSGPLSQDSQPFLRASETQRTKKWAWGIPRSHWLTLPQQVTPRNVCGVNSIKLSSKIKSTLEQEWVQWLSVYLTGREAWVHPSQTQTNEGHSGTGVSPVHGQENRLLGCSKIP